MVTTVLSRIAAAVALSALAAPSALGQITFAPPVSYTSGVETSGVAAADFDGDGILDIVACNAQESTVKIFRGLGDGTFVDGPLYPMNGRPVKVAVGDFNGDGRPDIVTTNFNSSTINVRLNISSGPGDFNFGGQLQMGMGGMPVDIVVADIYGDDTLDIAVVNQNENSISIRRGNGDGTFQARQVVGLPGGSGPRALAVGDLTGNGRLDIVTANASSNTLVVRRNVGPGVFEPPIIYPAGAFPNGVAIGDVSGDERLDVVTSAQFTQDVRVFINSGDPGNPLIDPGSGLPVGPDVRRVKLADLDLDDGLDIVACDCNTDTLWIYGFAFGAPIMINAGDCPVDIAFGDFNGDGKVDIVLADFVGSSITVLLNTSFVTPPPAVTLLAPKDCAVNVGPTPTLVWSALKGVSVTYTVRLGLDEELDDLVLVESGLKVNFLEIPSGTLMDNQRYFWQVSADGVGGSTPSAVFSFQTPRIGDLNGDGNVGSADLSLLLSNWGNVECP